MPVTETVALVTGIIGCASAIATTIQHLHPHLVQGYKKLLWCLEDPEKELQTIASEGSELKKLINSALLAINTGKWLPQAFDEAKKIEKCVESVNSEAHLFFGCLPNCCARYGIRKEIAEITVRVKQLTAEFQKESKNWGHMRILGNLEGRQTKEVIKDISKLFRDDNTLVIGVSGVGGIGKTEVVMHACKRILENSHDFLPFILVEASHEDDLKALQMKIARKIDLNLLGDNTTLQNAASLRTALMNVGKFLLVIDNLWNTFSLAQIGIPIGSPVAKVIITSRFSSVCSQMESGENIAMKFLSEQEASKLLISEISQNELNIPDEIIPTLENVANECGGLPLAIVKVARQIRSLNWSDHWAVEQQLKEKVEKFNILTYMEDNEVSNLKLSYDRLPSRRIKYCFLNCIMYPRNQKIVAKELMEYWMWEDLFGGAKFRHENFEDAEGKLAELKHAEDTLAQLKDASLLESESHQNGVEYVTIHPLIWDMVAHITERSSCFVTLAGRGLHNISPIYNQEVERISLMSNDIEELKFATGLEKLSTLLVQNNPNLEIDDDAWFPESLTILDISSTGISSLPKSLYRLIHLKVLLVRNCGALTSTSRLSLHKIKELVVFDISGSPITELPSGMNYLILLKRLNLSHTRLRSFPSGLVSLLCSLQELLMIGCHICWFSRDVEQNSEANLKELEDLSHLTVLQITFGNTKSFTDFIGSRRCRNLRSFKFCVGGPYSGKLRNNSLAFLKEFPSDHLPPDKTSQLLLMNCKGVTDLTLSGFGYLNILDVSYCAGLKYLFKLGILSNLMFLEEMIIACCRNMTNVIEKDDGKKTAGEISLPRLRKLTLFNLPKLQLFSDPEVKCDSVQTISVWNCRELRRFPVLLETDGPSELLKFVTPRDLKAVKGERSLFELWPSAAEAVQNLFVEEPPPEELISRSRYSSPSDDQASSSSQGGLGQKQ